jgi:Xaa-Pro aminopeptidase
MSSNINQLRNALKAIVESADTDYFYLPSFDHNLCEYVPASDSLRIFVSGFTGSVAEALVTKEGMIHLFVDGRYHEQADLECNPELVVVEKISYGKSLRGALLERLNSEDKVAVIGERTPLNLIDKIKEENLVALDEGRIFKDLQFTAPSFHGPLWEVSDRSEERFLEKVNDCLKKGEAAFINALDTLSWISGLRGAFLPYQGTFRGKAVMLTDGLHIFVSREQLELCKEYESTWRNFYPLDEFEKQCLVLLSDKTVLIDDRFSTLQNFWQIKKAVDEKSIVRHPSFHAAWQAIKKSYEHEYFRESFDKSDRAIYNGLDHLVKSARSGEPITELSFRDEVEKKYKEEGAKIQSFRTISGFGASSSIIHFGSPSEDKSIGEGEFVLLDSGAIYEQGFATDCTRTVVPFGVPTSSQILHYTLVLKGLIKVMTATFEVGTLGKSLDLLARGPLKENGLDFAHGTGHGVGVNVHEAGYSITPFSEAPMVAGLVGSIEPGFYIPGKGGIRLENIAIVKEAGPGQLCFENLVYIGFWHDLIDESLLSEEEFKYLLNYEEICLEKGRSFSHYATNPLAKR